MRFGYHHHVFDEDDPASGALERAEQVESAGFDWIDFMDHLWQIPMSGTARDPFLDAYTMLPAVAERTSDIEIAPLVTSVTYRNPAMLARTLTTLDHLADGRLTLGIGAGWYEPEATAYDIEFPDAAQRVHRLRDAIQLLRAVWADETPVSYDGEFYEVEDLYLSPKPVSEPHPSILVGGGGEELTLKVVAEYADAWNVPCRDPRRYEQKLSVLRDHCETFGRSYDEIEKTVLTPVLLRETTAEAHEAFESIQSETWMDPIPPEGERGAVGTVAEATELFDRFESAGVSLLMTTVPGNDEETIRRLSDEVLPQY